MDMRLVAREKQLENWAALIQECKNSGMKTKDWLMQNNISRDQYYYWLRLVRELGIDKFVATLVANGINDPMTEDTLYLFCGRKTDRIKGIVWERDGYLLFNEAEAFADASADELTEEVIRKRGKKKKGKKASDIDGLPKEIINHEMTDEELTELYPDEDWKRLPDEVYHRYRLYTMKSPGFRICQQIKGKKSVKKQ